jgi:hypothetical protein
MTKAADARARRKAMLSPGRLEPVTRTVIRAPWDGTKAKTGRAVFLDADDEAVVSVTVTRDAHGRLVVEMTSTEPVVVATQVYADPDAAA